FARLVEIPASEVIQGPVQVSRARMREERRKSTVRICTAVFSVSTNSEIPEYWQTARQILPKHKHPHTGRSRYVPSVLVSPSHTLTHTRTEACATARAVGSADIVARGFNRGIRYQLVDYDPYTRTFARIDL